MTNGKLFANRYHLCEKTGGNNRAAIYKALDDVLGRNVAVKILSPQYTAAADFNERFKAQCQAAAALSCPSIVHIYDYGQDKGLYYVVNEYVEGADIKTAVNQRGKIGQRRAAKIGLRVCEALETAHEQNVIHGAISSSNIIVRPDGCVKVADFGIPRLSRLDLTRNQSSLISPEYLSPEQIQGQAPSAASDIYSLGVVLYEALSGQLPFQAENALTTANQQLYDQPKPLSRLDSSMSPVLENIVAKAMAKEPSLRYRSAAEMKDALADYLRNGHTPSQAAATRTVGDFNPDAIGARALEGGNGAVSAAYAAAGYGSDADRTRVMSSERSAARGSSRSTAGARSSYASQIAARYDDGTVMMPPSVRQQARNSAANRSAGARDASSRSVANRSAAQRNADPYDSYGVDMPQRGIQQADPYQEEDRAYRQYRRMEEAMPPKKRIWPFIAAAAAAVVLIGAGLGIYFGFFANRVTIPDVTGLTLIDAETAIENAGLSIGFKDNVDSESVEAGCVISQDPKGNNKVKKNSIVNLKVSSGSATAEKLVVPKILGLSAGEAEAAIIAAGFVPAAASGEASDVYAVGQICRQAPDSGSALAAGSKVSYSISLGKGNVSVPDVMGKSQVDATNVLMNAKLTVQVEEEYSDSYDSGKVMRQNPSANTSVAADSVVTITISKGKKAGSDTTPAADDTVKVPNFENMNEEDAKQTAVYYNLKLNISYLEDSSVVDEKDEVVSDQNPVEGTEVKAQSTINVTIVKKPKASGEN